MTRFAYRRISTAPPPEREQLEVSDDGRFELWRSNGPIVGRFTGSVPDGAAVSAAASAAAGAPPPAGPRGTPDASIEVVEIGDARARVEEGALESGPWGDVLDLGRRLIDDLTTQPSSAVALVVESPTRLRLEHRGVEPLVLELEDAQATVQVWHDGSQAGSGGTGPLGQGEVSAGPGWSLGIELPEVPTPAGAMLIARVEFVVDDGGVYVPVMLMAGPVTL